MPVQTLEDVCRFLGHVRQKVLRRVEQMEPEMRQWRPAPDKWSALEHLEHLALTERRLVDELEVLATEAEAAGLTASADSPRLVDAMPALQAAGAIGTRKQAPAYAVPSGRSLGEIQQMLSASRTRLLALAERLALLDTDRIRIRLPVTEAEMTLAQALHFVGVHEYLHDTHVQANIKARGGL